MAGDEEAPLSPATAVMMLGSKARAQATLVETPETVNHDQSFLSLLSGELQSVNKLSNTAISIRQ